MRPIVNAYPESLPACCVSHACSFRFGGNNSKISPTPHSEEKYIVDNVYKQFVLDRYVMFLVIVTSHNPSTQQTLLYRKGNVRLKDLPLILATASIAFDASRISEKEWSLHSEALLFYDEFDRLTDLLRCDVFIPEDINERLYKVPGAKRNHLFVQFAMISQSVFSPLPSAATNPKTG